MKSCSINILLAMFFFLVSTFISCAAEEKDEVNPGKGNGSGQNEEPNPNQGGEEPINLPLTISWNENNLKQVKTKINTVAYKTVYEKLLRDADSELSKRAPSVMDKPLIAPSGDKHDFLSISKYWWPNPNTADGLPYIKKDGETNPDTQILDEQALPAMTKSVIRLGLAYYFSGDEKYAKKAVELIRVWFLNPDTKMNPSVNYAGIRPGHDGNVGTGILPLYGFVEMLDVVALLSSSPNFPESDQTQLKEWFTDLTDWINTSTIGTNDRKKANNIAVIHDVQLACYALYTGKYALALELINEFPQKRIYKQIEPNGSQPLELDRTNAFGYSSYNISNMMKMAAIAQSAGVDLFNMQSADGRSIPKAMDFLIPYLGNGKRNFPYDQTTDWDKDAEQLYWAFKQTRFFNPVRDYSAFFNQYYDTSKYSSTNYKYLIY